MILLLSTLPATLSGPNDPDYRGQVPKRARFLAPDAAQSLAELEADSGGLVYTDIFRGATESLAALRTKRGVQRPGYSAHGFGLAVDLDITQTLLKLKIKYPQLVDLMAKHEWYCHRRDLQSEAPEAWHFNFLGRDALPYLNLAISVDHSTWAAPVEKRITDRYGKDFFLTNEASQRSLAQLGLYRGEPDGILGPISKEAIQAFQRAWYLSPESGGLDPRTQRTLAYVSAQVSLQDQQSQQA